MIKLINELYLKTTNFLMEPYVQNKKSENEKEKTDIYYEYWIYYKDGTITKGDTKDLEWAKARFNEHINKIGYKPTTKGLGGYEVIKVEMYEVEKKYNKIMEEG